jgi:hypothetical protein
MNERQNSLFGKYTHYNIKSKKKKIIMNNPLKNTDSKRYDSAKSRKNKINRNEIKFRDDAPIKNIEFFPEKKDVQKKHITRNKTVIRLRPFYKTKSTSSINRSIKQKSTKSRNKINALYLNTKIFYKHVNFANENEKFQEKHKNQNQNQKKEKERFKFLKLLNCINNRKNNFINTYLNRNQENEKVDNININNNKRESCTMYIENNINMKSKLPFNTLKHYHRYLFNEEKTECKGQGEEYSNKKMMLIKVMIPIPE